MKNQIKCFNVFYLVCFFFIACLQTGCLKTLSSTKWGILTDNLSAITMLRVPPPSSADGKSVVAVCADKDEIREYVTQSILVWAKTVGRDQWIEFSNKCSSAGSYSNYFNDYGGVFDTSGNGGITATQNSGIKTGNDTGVQLYASSGQMGGNVAAYTYPTTGEIKYGPSTNFSIILHEVGHNWGLCDQYPGVANCNDTVKGHTNMDKVGSSVMGAASNINLLTQDDIDGIRYIVNLSGVGANEKWKEFLKEHLTADKAGSSDDSSNSNTSKTSNKINNSGSILDNLNNNNWNVDGFTSSYSSGNWKDAVKNTSRPTFEELYNDKNLEYKAPYNNNFLFGSWSN